MARASSKWAKVLYRYEGSQWTAYHSTNINITTETEFVEVPCPDAKHFVFGTFLSKNYSLGSSYGGCDVWRHWRTKNPVPVPVTDPYIPIGDSRWVIDDKDGVVHLIQAIRNIQYIEESQENISGRTPIKNKIGDCGNTSRPLGALASKDFIVRPDNEPICYECKFSIKKEGITTFSRQKEDCPEEIKIIYEAETCPPNTCECNSGGGLVCCYNSKTGQVIKSFIR